MIAMALSCNPKLLIADEPTTALDVTTQSQILNLMRDLQHEYGMAIMFITHDLGVIAEMADEVVVMYLGKEAEVADVDTIYYNPAHPYTQALLRSIPRPDAQLERLETIEGNVPTRRTSRKAAPFTRAAAITSPANAAARPTCRSASSNGRAARVSTRSIRSSRRRSRRNDRREQYCF